MSEEQAQRKGTLIIIGGHEDRDPEGKRTILREVAKRVNGGKLVLATVASHQPEGYFDDYEKAFADLELGGLCELYVEDRAEASHPEKLDIIDDAAAIFFSGETSCASPARSATPASKPRCGRFTNAAALSPARPLAHR
jgi:cyanophycinase